jgi:hypothetical protein
MKKPLLPSKKKPPKKMPLKQELDELIQKVQAKKKLEECVRTIELFN